MPGGPEIGRSAEPQIGRSADRESKVAFLARRYHPLAMVRRAEAEAGHVEAVFQLAVLDAIDLSQEPAGELARLARWRKSLTARVQSRIRV